MCRCMFHRGELCARREDVRHVARVPNKSHLRLGPRVPLQQRNQRPRHRQVRQGLADELRLHPAIPGDFSMSR